MLGFELGGIGRDASFVEDGLRQGGQGIAWHCFLPRTNCECLLGAGQPFIGYSKGILLFDDFEKPEADEPEKKANGSATRLGANFGLIMLKLSRTNMRRTQNIVRALQMAVAALGLTSPISAGTPPREISAKSADTEKSAERSVQLFN